MRGELGLLRLTTEFGRDKRTAQVVARAATATFLGDVSVGRIAGYQIHMGRTVRATEPGVFAVETRNGNADDEHDGAVSGDGSVVGTMIHGLFDNPAVRTALLRHLRERRGLSPVAERSAAPPYDEHDRLAAVLRENVDMRLLRTLIGI